MGARRYLRYRFRPSAWWRSIVFRWLARDSGGGSFFAMLALPIVAIFSIVAFAYSGRGRDEAAHLEAARIRAAELRCLAENVYFEARGEPLDGQYAVAEVTLNRTRSPYFPKTVCGVVHDTRWDPERRRFVAHFSWTQMEPKSDPWGPAWQDAIAVAGAVYDESYMPRVPDALYYHAIGVQPYWASSRHQVARIGNHVFYR
jgi:spore germination cell wall hydrolase CwlJ-like protein